MKDIDYLVDVYRRCTGMLKMHLSDFSDADLLARPTDSANNAAWQVGHLINSTTNVINAVTPGAMPPQPEAVLEGKQQLLESFGRMIDSAVAWVKDLSDADKAVVTPEKFHGFARTVGELAIMLPVHVSMHVGQIQVIRRKLGKPVLF